MRKLICLLLIIASFSADAQQTGPDTSFGAQGIVMISDTSLYMQNNRLTVQPDGKIVLAGTYYYYLPNFDLVYRQVIMRFNPNGSRDSSFNQTGAIVKEVGRGARISSVLVQPDSRILLLANTYIERYLPNGSPDSSFNDSARFVYDFLGPYDAITGMALQPDGKIVTGGIWLDSYALLFRLKANGTPDTSFGYNGLVNTTLDSSALDMGNAVALQPDGRIVLAGSSVIRHSNGTYDYFFSAIRYLTDGSLDPAFGNGRGYVRAQFPNQKSCGGSFVCVQPGGKIVLGGVAYYDVGNSYRAQTALMGITAAGIVDSSFGINGRITDDTVYNGIAYYNYGPFMRMQPDGKILMAYPQQTGSTGYNFTLHRFNTNGYIDVSFGTQGKVTTDITVNDDICNDVQVQPDGRILVCGIADITNSWPQSYHSYPAVVRYGPNAHLAVPEVPGGIKNTVVYPNPVSGSFTLGYELAHSDVLTICLTDISGRTVQQFLQNEIRSAGWHTEYFALPATLAAGNYFVVINSSAGTAKTLKIVRE